MKIAKIIAAFILVSTLTFITSYALEKLTGEKPPHSFGILLFVMMWLHLGVVNRIDKLKK